jgi:hypothetical protein
LWRVIELLSGLGPILLLLLLRLGKVLLRVVIGLVLAVLTVVCWGMRLRTPVLRLGTDILLLVCKLLQKLLLVLVQRLHTVQLRRCDRAIGAETWRWSHF